MNKLLEIINQVRATPKLRILPTLNSAARFREELDFVSLDLAVLTVRIEELLADGVFADGLVDTMGKVK